MVSIIKDERVGRESSPSAKKHSNPLFTYLFEGRHVHGWNSRMGQQRGGGPTATGGGGGGRPRSPLVLSSASLRRYKRNPIVFRKPFAYTQRMKLFDANTSEEISSRYICPGLSCL